MFEIVEDFEITASHNFYNHITGGKIHGHTWHIRIHAQRRNIDKNGIIIDFDKFREEIKIELSKFDHKYLNNLDEFEKKNPTTEVIAIVLFEDLKKTINTPTLKISKIELVEGDRRKIVYFE